jgi:2-polyprenyl-6-methoxyphenol hydroxylase-like FAD-dependent oxidoreductase
MKILFLFFVLIAHASQIVVIGGGPTGLGAAIEARLSGYEVIIVEKREEYSRLSTMSLSANTLDIFEKWDLEIPLLEILDFNGTRRGFILLKDLEAGLFKKALELGIQRIQGEFIDFGKFNCAMIEAENGRDLISYDLLIAADGAHSRVREKLGISPITLARAFGGICMVPAQNKPGVLTVEFKPYPNLLTKKVNVPHASVLFFQNKQGDLHLNKMIHLASELGWVDEAVKMGQEQCIALESIPIYLQRVNTFSDPIRSVILLGDAAACASFYSGAGVNFCFQTTQLAGKLLSDSNYATFNQEMQIEVEKLMQLNLPFFE